MKKIHELLKKIDIITTSGNFDGDILSIHFDSRSTLSESLFVAIQGTETNGTEFISDAIHRGARVIVYDSECECTDPNILYVRVPDSKVALAQIAQNFYDNPSEKLILVGVTGTNGKTTTATLLYKLFRLLGYHVALISTIENKIDDRIFPATHTTPDPLSLAKFLSDAVRDGCTHAFMECSSHGIHQKRIHSLNFRGAIFTNLTHDHLDYHQTMESYADAKKELFDMLLPSAFALANDDDTRGRYILQNTSAKKYFFGIATKHSIHFKGEILQTQLTGTKFLINGKNIATRLIGTYNTYNILGVYATAILLGIPEAKVSDTISLLDPPSGRFEYITGTTHIHGIVDYAHTPDALENILITVRQVIPKTSKIITVVGCGGNRDKTKRPLMGEIAQKLSDFVVYTSDNPRKENPEDIISDMTAHLPQSTNHISIVNRSEAIADACKRGKSGDVVLVCGKGHEQYQIFADHTDHFSDTEELRKNFSPTV